MLKPTNKRILIEPLSEKESTVGGLIVPEKFQDKPSEGIVVALPDNNVIDVKIGDRVFVNRWDGTEIKMGTKLYKMVQPNEVLAVIG